MKRGMALGTSAEFTALTFGRMKELYGECKKKHSIKGKILEQTKAASTFGTSSKKKSHQRRSVCSTESKGNRKDRASSFGKQIVQRNGKWREGTVLNVLDNQSCVGQQQIPNKRVNSIWVLREDETEEGRGICRSQSSARGNVSTSH